MTGIEAKVSAALHALGEFIVTNSGVVLAAVEVVRIGRAFMKARKGKRK
jgi:hypothetical protein